jgi:hypothetical protein
MDPVFTLQWPEALTADYLQRELPKSGGYSVLIPASRQEKAIDLAVIRKRGDGKSRTITLQVKASRVYMPPPPKRKNVERFRFYTWFNRFEVPQEADFFILFGMYAPEPERTKHITFKWYRSISLLFTNAEMQSFIDACLTVGGKRDRMFGFGFNDETRIVLTRGDQYRGRTEFTHRLLERRLDLIRRALALPGER